MTNGRGAFSNSLAEYSVAAMLHFNKQLPRLAANKVNAVWDNFVMDTMEGKTVGLVGYGSIGQATAQMAKAAFGCKIIALRRQAAAGDPAGVADEVLGFEERDKLFRECDFVVCSLPKTVRDSPHRQGSSSSFFLAVTSTRPRVRIATETATVNNPPPSIHNKPDTIGFVGKAEISAMKSSAVFISIGRGAAVDEDALAEALAAGRIKGAALDVFAQEPLPPSSPFWRLGNVLLTAHNADYTADYLQLGWDVFEENAALFAKDEELATPVDVQRGY